MNTHLRQSAPPSVGRSNVLRLLAQSAFCVLLATGLVQRSPGKLPSVAEVGPFNVAILEGSVGLSRPLSAQLNLVTGNGPWFLSGWINQPRQQPGRVIVASIGDPTAGKPEENWHGLFLDESRLGAAVGRGVMLRSARAITPGRWHFVAASFDGAIARLYLDGDVQNSAALSMPKPTEPSATLAAPRLDIAPTGRGAHFGGLLALLELASDAPTDTVIRNMARQAPDFSLITFDHVGVGWPLQERAWRGLQTPQDAWTLPSGMTPPQPPHVAPASPPTADLEPRQDGAFALTHWHLAAAHSVGASGPTVSLASYAESGWYPAIVPGTVLSTLIARGVYPDSDYGLNNLAIPDELSRQDFWYRTTFQTPAALQGRRITLTFNGINYAAEIWINGTSVGTMTGAFRRGVFDVTSALRLNGERNALAVRVSPPPHPGIPHEQSIAAGPGENGGALALDGPTFIATEGWDWIPGIRDRNTGLWQEVELKASGTVRIVDPQVVTHLPLPRTDSAEVRIVVPVENVGAETAATIRASFGQVQVEKTVMLPTGPSEVILDAREFSQLRVRNPRLWWPNGYGEPNLYALRIEAVDGADLSDVYSTRFGIRELTYDLSLFDHEGRLRRVEVDPTLGAMQSERLTDVSHEGIKRTPQGWAESLTTAGERSSAVRASATESLTPYLALRVNGVPIAARGGNWGMDDSRKRSSRERLEPYFRLHRDAHLNIIRNWLGQSTEQVFYDLADEYGLLVLNDFWASTQNFQLEPGDPELFLANARDVIVRYRNHPSIAMWFGRNEGVPPPIINDGLAELAATLDGTRYYTGSSNSVNLQSSGPYNYRPPEQYFTQLAQGFSVEVGTPSLATLEAIEASIPPADRWPLGDVYAYHDWHFGGNGDVASFMDAIRVEHGAPSGLKDFEKKAQLMNFESYRAIFEGFAAHLWTTNSGRLLWMSHPSWPSNTWQIYSSDYDTAAAYYAVKKACEPLHVQMNLPDFSLAVVNTTRSARPHLELESRIYSTTGALLAQQTTSVDAPANAVTTLPRLELARLLEAERLVFVELTLRDAQHHVVSENVYWPSQAPADQQRLDELAVQPAELTARAEADAAGKTVIVQLINRGNAPLLSAKLTVLDDSGARVLPVYYSDNYMTLMAGESREVRIACPLACTKIALRGWNVAARTVEIR